MSHSLCKRCSIQSTCSLNYDGKPCRKERDVEPTCFDVIMDMDVEELADFLSEWHEDRKVWKGDCGGNEIYCPFFGWYADYDKCPVFLQLPEGHGRMVDADALKEWFIEQIDYYKRFDGPNCSMMVSAYEAVCRVINDAPTIVPAERRET